MSCKNCGEIKKKSTNQKPTETFSTALIDKITKMIDLALPLLIVAKNDRQTCLECVEKHLGAAAVLLSEVPDSYTVHRLYAIGHLHEAAEEATNYPELQQMIRKARIEYQQYSTIPDFVVLVELLYRLRKASAV